MNNMGLHRQTSNHYYGWNGIPGQWTNDNDRSYPDRFFDDKNYEDFYFDNFYDMDKMFGHENSLFGTRGLPVGHPNRSSKSFDTYNKKFGPMIVRVIKTNDLQEQIRRILREEFLNEGNIKIPQSEIDKAGVLLDLINSDIEKYKNRAVGFVIFSNGIVETSEKFILLTKTESLDEAAQNLYAAMHQLDAQGFDFVIAEKFPETGIGISLNDRLCRAQEVEFDKETQKEINNPNNS
jgi:hypothetical protein